ncbi:hypothetical protein KEM54_000313 [Ascosphaera aggregata]|nr:hypothetical protein KEM54_000313 [Ascosphaera aggregata]
MPGDCAAYFSSSRLISMFPSLMAWSYEHLTSTTYPLASNDWRFKKFRAVSVKILDINATNRAAMSLFTFYQAHRTDDTSTAAELGIMSIWPQRLQSLDSATLRRSSTDRKVSL